MQEEKIYSGNNEGEIWDQLKADLGKDQFIEYHATLIQNKKEITLDIDLDPGGGFENGVSNTRFSGTLNATDYRLAIHPQNLIDDIGKLFGLNDVIIGYPEFDKKFIIKTNNSGKTQTLFSETNCRKVLEALEDFTLETTGNNENNIGENKKLILNIEEGIISVERLKKIYHAFLMLVTGIETIT